MSSIAVTSQDAIKINGRLITGFADEDNAKITFPEDLSNSTTGKDGNSIIAFKWNGKNGELEIRLLIGHSDDKFLNRLLSNYINNPANFTLMTMEFDKFVGDGQGNISTVVYQGIGGTFKKQPEVMENASGETKQAVVVWNLKFTNINRNIE